MRGVFFSITVLLLWCPIGGAGAAEWFESGPSGIIGDPVDEGPGTEGWRLAVVRENETEERRLYSDGELYSSVRLSRLGGQLLFWEERDARGGLTARVEYSYDAEGNPRASYIESWDLGDSGDSGGIQGIQGIRFRGLSLRGVSTPIWWSGAIRAGRAAAGLLPISTPGVIRPDGCPLRTERW